MRAWPEPTIPLRYWFKKHRTNSIAEQLNLGPRPRRCKLVNMNPNLARSNMLSHQPQATGAVPKRAE